MANPMSNEERRTFLMEGTRTGHLAVTRKDGRPHAAPIWFVLDGDDVIFNTRKQSIKGRALERTGRAHLSVDDARPPYNFVTISGTVELLDDPDQKRRWATAIAARYMGDDQAEAYGIRNSDADEWLVRLRPEHIVAQADVSGW